MPKTTTITVHQTPTEPRRVCVEAYPVGGGWRVYAPSNGGIGTVYASADTSAELMAWARKAGLKPTLFD